MKIGIDCGHTLSGADYGANGIKSESILTRELGTKVMNLFKAAGHSVINCTCDNASSLHDSLAYRVNTANRNSCDYYISIHFNAFNGNAKGTEILVYNTTDSRVNGVLRRITTLGFKNRGVKQRPGLYVLKNTNMKAMLIEVCFCDNPEDMKTYDANEMAKAIVEGFLGAKVKTETTPTKSGKVEEIQNLINNYVGNKVVVDGIFGPETDKYLKFLPTQSISRYKSDLTQWIQLRLGCYPDGIFGSITANDVMTYQRENNIHVSGYVDYYTYKSLILK